MTREEAKDVLKEIKDTIKLYNSLSGTQTFVVYPKALDLAIESLSAEEVVRCKNCVWHMNDYMGEWCGRLRGHPGMSATDFCSKGERREE